MTFYNECFLAVKKNNCIFKIYENLYFDGPGNRAELFDFLLYYKKLWNPERLKSFFYRLSILNYS